MVQASTEILSPWWIWSTLPTNWKSTRSAFFKSVLNNLERLHVAICKVTPRSFDSVAELDMHSSYPCWLAAVLRSSLSRLRIAFSVYRHKIFTDAVIVSGILIPIIGFALSLKAAVRTCPWSWCGSSWHPVCHPDRSEFSACFKQYLLVMYR